MLSWFYNGGFFGNSNWCVTNGCFTRTGTASACAPSARRLCWAAWVVRIPSKPGTLSPCGAERKAESRTCATSSTEYFTFKNEKSGIQKNIRLLVLQRQSRLKKALLRFFLNAVPSVPRTDSERTSVCALRLKTQCLKPVAASRRRDNLYSRENFGGSARSGQNSIKKISFSYKYFKSTYHKLKASTHTFSYISLYVL